MSVIARPDSMLSAVKLLSDCDTFVIGAHVDPDGDTIGSCLALCIALRNIGKSAWVICDDSVPTNLDFLKVELVMTPDQLVDKLGDLPEFDVGLAVDAGDIGRLGSSYKLIRRADRIVNIDHHPTNDGYGDINLIDPNSASTAEIVLKLLKDGPYPITSDMAAALYTGVCTDTGCFKFSNTTVEVFQTAAELVQLGANPGAITQAIYDRRSFGYLNLLGRCLSSLNVSEDGRVGWCILARDDIVKANVPSSELDGFVSYPRMINGVIAAIMFTELGDGKIKVSLRSKEIVDVSAIAQKLGGGGHKRAAGATVSGSLTDVVKNTLSLFGVAPPSDIS